MSLSFRKCWVLCLRQKENKEYFFPQGAILSTCNHAVRGGYTLEHLLDEPHISAGLQVADTLLEDGSEDAPDLGLTGGLTLVQQLHHAHDALGFLDDEVHLQVKLAADQLEEREKKERGEEGSTGGERETRNERESVQFQLVIE